MEFNEWDQQINNFNIINNPFQNNLLEQLNNKIAKFSFNSDLNQLILPQHVERAIPHQSNLSNGNHQSIFYVPTSENIWKCNHYSKGSSEDEELHYDMIVLLLASEQPSIGIIQNWELVYSVSLSKLYQIPNIQLNSVTNKSYQEETFNVMNFYALQLYDIDVLSEKSERNKYKRLMFLSYQDTWNIVYIEEKIVPSSKGNSTLKTSSTSNKSNHKVTNQELNENQLDQDSFFKIILSGNWKEKTDSERIILWCSSGENNKRVFKYIEKKDGGILEVLNLQKAIDNLIKEIETKKKNKVNILDLISITSNRISLRGDSIFAQSLFLKKFPGDRYIAFLEKHSGGWYQISTYREEDCQLGPWCVENLPSTPIAIYYHRQEGIVYVSTKCIQYISNSVVNLDLPEAIIHSCQLHIRKNLSDKGLMQFIQNFVLISEMNVYLIELKHEIRSQSTLKIIASEKLPNNLYHRSDSTNSPCFYSILHTTSSNSATVYMMNNSTDYLLHLNLQNSKISIDSNPTLNIIGAIKNVTPVPILNSPYFIINDGIKSKKCVFGNELTLLTEINDDSSFNNEYQLFSIEYGTHSLIFLTNSSSTRVLFTKSMSSIVLPSLKKDKRSIFICESGEDSFIQVVDTEITLSSITRGTIYSTWKPKEGIIHVASKCKPDRLLVATENTLYLLESTNQKLEPTLLYRFDNQISSLFLFFHENLKRYIALVGLWIENSIAILDVKLKKIIGLIKLDSNIRSIYSIFKSKSNEFIIFSGLSNGYCAITVVSIENSKNIKIICTKKFFLGPKLINFTSLNSNTVISNGYDSITIELDKWTSNLNIYQIFSRDNLKISNLSRIVTNQFGSCFIGFVKNHNSQSLVLCQITQLPKLSWRLIGESYMNCTYIDKKSQLIYILGCKQSTLQLFDDKLKPLDENLNFEKENIISACTCSINYTPILDHESFKNEKIESIQKEIIAIHSYMEKDSSRVNLLHFVTISKSKKLIQEGISILGEGISTLPLRSSGPFIIFNLNNKFYLGKIMIDEKNGTQFNLNILHELVVKIPKGLQLSRLEIEDTFSAIDILINSENNQEVVICASSFKHGLTLWRFNSFTNSLEIIASDALDRKEKEPYQGEMFCSAIKLLSPKNILIGTHDGKIKLLTLQKMRHESIPLKFIDADQIRNSLVKYVINEPKVKIEGEIVSQDENDQKEIQSNIPNYSFVKLVEDQLNGIITSFAFMKLSLSDEHASILYTTSIGGIGTIALLQDFNEAQNTNSIIDGNIIYNKLKTANRLSQEELQTFSNILKRLHS